MTVIPKAARSLFFFLTSMFVIYMQKWAKSSPSYWPHPRGNIRTCSHNENSRQIPVIFFPSDLWSIFSPPRDFFSSSPLDFDRTCRKKREKENVAQPRYRESSSCSWTDKGSLTLFSLFTSWIQWRLGVSIMLYLMAGICLYLWARSSRWLCKGNPDNAWFGVISFR